MRSLYNMYTDSARVQQTNMNYALVRWGKTIRCVETHVHYMHFRYRPVPPSMLRHRLAWASVWTWIPVNLHNWFIAQVLAHPSGNVYILYTLVYNLRHRAMSVQCFTQPRPHGTSARFWHGDVLAAYPGFNVGQNPADGSTIGGSTGRKVFHFIRFKTFWLVNSCSFYISLSYRDKGHLLLLFLILRKFVEANYKQAWHNFLFLDFTQNHVYVPWKSINMYLCTLFAYNDWYDVYDLNHEWYGDLGI